MKTRIARLAGMALMALGLGACTITVPLDKPPAGMSELQARAVLIRLRTEYWYANDPDRGYTPIWSDNRTVANGRDLVIARDGLHFKSFIIPFADISRVTVGKDGNIVRIYLADHQAFDFLAPTKRLDHFFDGASAAAAQAIVVLKLAAKTWPARDAAFEQAAAGYRAANPKPQPGEQQRQSEVQAETQVADKQFLQAAETYQRAVDEAPWWPQGHFNFALVLESLGDYELAIEEMQRYLALVPDADNARAAQDKIYAWQARLSAHNF